MDTKKDAATALAPPSSAPKAQVIFAPSREEHTGEKSIFLAGTTTPTGQPNWRDTLTSTLKQDPVTLLDPNRDDWDSMWKENFSDSRWVEQVNWELDMQEKADFVVVFFHGVSAAPISMLELGLCVKMAVLGRLYVL